MDIQGLKDALDPREWAQRIKSWGTALGKWANQAKALATHVRTTPQVARGDAKDAVHRYAEKIKNKGIAAGPALLQSAQRVAASAQKNVVLAVRNPRSLRDGVWPQRIAKALGVWVLLLMLLWLGFAVFGKGQIERFASHQLGRKVTVGRASFKPWSFEFNLHDVVVASSDGKGVQLKVAHVYVDAELQSLFRRAPVVDALTLDAPRLNLAHTGNGRYDVDDLIQRWVSAPSTAKFAIHNIVIDQGSMEYVDNVSGKSHALSQLRLQIPFFSNMDLDRTIHVQPRLGFVLAGKAFDSAAQGARFAQTGKRNATLHLAAFDLAPYASYIPESMPIKLQAGIVDADINLNFEHGASKGIQLSGTVLAQKGRLVDVRNADLASWDKATLTLTDVRPFQEVLSLSQLALENPHIYLTRNSAGKLNWDFEDAPNAAQTVLSPTSSPIAQPVVQLPVQSASTASARATAHDEGRFGGIGTYKINIGQINIQSGQLTWHDESAIKKIVDVGLEQFTLDAKDVRWPMERNAQPSPFSGTAKILPSAQDAGALQFTGIASDRSATIKFNMQRAPLAVVDAMAAQSLALPLHGHVSAEASVFWTLSEPDNPGQFLLGAKHVVIEDASLGGALAVPQSAAVVPAMALPEAAVAGSSVTRASAVASAPKQPVGNMPALSKVAQSMQRPMPDANAAASTAATHVLPNSLAKFGGSSFSHPASQASQRLASVASARLIGINELQLDGLSRTLELDRVSITQPVLHVQRGADNRWSWERWVKNKNLWGNKDLPWIMSLRELAASEGKVLYIDQAQQPSANIELSAVKLNITDFSNAADAKTAQLGVSARVIGHTKQASARLPAGALSYQGEFGGSPLHALGVLNVTQLPLQMLSPFWLESTNTHWPSGQLNFKGRALYVNLSKGAKLQFSGDASLNGVRVSGNVPAGTTATNGATGFSFSEPSAAQHQAVGVVPAAIESVPLAVNPSESVTANEALVTSSRQHGRDILQGRLSRTGNTTDLWGWRRLALAGVQLSVEPEQPMRLDFQTGIANDFYANMVMLEQGRLNTQDAFQWRKSASYSAPLFGWSALQLVGGEIIFTDRTVRPAYSTVLNDINGKIGVLPAGNTAATEAQMRAKWGGAGQLKIEGKLNPFSKVMDIKAEARELDAQAFSTYTKKYAGYGLEKGRLNADAHYVVSPEGQLTAAQNFTWMQPGLGTKVENADASLSAKLDVATLTDRNGNVLLNVPIAGRLDDTPLIGTAFAKAIQTLLSKASAVPSVVTPAASPSATTP